MRRVLRVHLLIAVMLLQTVVWLSPFAIGAHTKQWAHLTVHAQDIDHHHHDDDSLHLAPDSDSTASHFHVDDGFQPMGLTARFGESGFAAMPSTPPATFISKPPTVFLDGLLRPPSLTA